MPSIVEKAVLLLHNSCDQKYDNIIGVQVYISKPTNSEFIAMIVDSIMDISVEIDTFFG
ncbi:sporulation initiation factor Spo0A C-terminal domain-containing protein [Psychrobacillus sp. MER TA 171]|uniref:sporulation initiation factor Spo0A C-terminal domain-containing protein n=1 Tax=Psychrobacillus sp. MER TA 171 TaxID=2939577 RepID=UPI00203A5AC7|nr:sporulation initiation factor Spo0A C-terminal domain-containing protein [Psychrobacillus sp. MER TA 171]MCM3359910.1 sporulation initiation factor Spo0A C-terminal domain-containing protein [Psychrobacillus sp. MER TA 171]